MKTIWTRKSCVMLVMFRLVPQMMMLAHLHHLMFLSQEEKTSTNDCKP